MVSFVHLCFIAHNPCLCKVRTVTNLLVKNLLSGKENVMIPLFLVTFIVFIIWFRVKMKQNNSTISEADEAFWARERNANFVRKKDISNLELLRVNLEELPFSQNPDEREAELAAKVRKCAEAKMLNLTGYSNTDLKEQYGTGNLEELTDWDQNFMYFIRSLSQWGNYLYEKKDYSRTRSIMEYSIEIGSDISTVYTTLGAIYAREHNWDKVDELISLVEASDFPLKDSMLKKLKLTKLEY